MVPALVRARQRPKRKGEVIVPRADLYVLQIESYAGKDTARAQMGGEEQRMPISGDYPGDTLYSVVKISDGKAEIVDDGYRSEQEARSTWPEAK